MVGTYIMIHHDIKVLYALTFSSISRKTSCKINIRKGDNHGTSRITMKQHSLNNAPQRTHQNEPAQPPMTPSLQQRTNSTIITHIKYTQRNWTPLGNLFLLFI